MKFINKKELFRKNKIITYALLSCTIIATQPAFAMEEESRQGFAPRGPMIDSHGRVEGIDPNYGNPLGDAELAPRVE